MQLHWMPSSVQDEAGTTGPALAGSLQAWVRDLGGLDADVLVQLGVRKRQLHSLLDLRDLLLQAAHVCVRLERRLLHLHAQPGPAEAPPVQEAPTGRLTAGCAGPSQQPKCWDPGACAGCLPAQ